MQGKLKLIYLLLILTLNFSCVEQQSPDKEAVEANAISTSAPDSLKFSSAIRAIFQDSRGHYWIGSHNEGLSRYDGISFEYFTSNDGLPDHQVRSIQEDKNGNVWFETARGVASYDGTKLSNHAAVVNIDSQNDWAKTDGDLWFGAGNNEGVYRYDGQKLNYLAFPAHEVINPYDNLYAVTGIAEGQNNTIWLGTYAGIWGYDGSDFTVINDESLGQDRSNEALHIRSILEDSKGRLWIGNNGIGVLLREGGEVIHFSEKHKLIHPSSTGRGDQSEPGSLEHVFTIAEDGHGNIWFGDRDTGIWKYDGKSMKNYTKKDGLTNDFAQSIYADKNGEVWFGMADGNIYKYKGQAFEKQF